jgi:hypothetical protein
MAATGRRSALIRGDKGRGVLRAKHEQDRLTAEAVFRRLVARAGGNSPVKEADFLKGSDGAPNALFCQIQLAMLDQGTAINRKAVRDPARRGPEARKEDG